MKKLMLILLICVLTIAGFSLVYGQKILPAAYFTSPRLSETVTIQLAKDSLVILDIDNFKNNIGNIELLKKLNPHIILLVYTNPLELFPNPGINRPWQQSIVNQLDSLYPGWFLKTDKGNNAVFTPKMVMMNVSTDCPKIKGQTYADWMVDQLIPVLRDSLVDGYFCDNGSGNWSWIYSNSDEKIDANNDDRPDSDYVLDHDMSEGVHGFLQKIRQAMGKKFIIVANKGSVEYMDVLNGRMFENWPNDYLGDSRDGGWWQCLLNGWKTGDYTIIKIKSATDLEFAYLSARLLGHKVYIAIGQDNSNPYPPFHPDSLGRIMNIEIKAHFEKGTIKIVPSKNQAEIIKETP